MSARDLFGVGVRLLGLWIGYTGLQYVLSWISLSMATLSQSRTSAASIC